MNDKEQNVFFDKIGYLENNRFSTLNTFSLGGILTAGAILYTGYKLSDDIQDVESAIRDATIALESIRDELDRLNDNIETILEILKLLPNAIRGIIKEEIVKKAIVDALTTSEQISTFLIDKPTFLANFEEVRHRVGELELYTNEIFATAGKDSLTAFFATAPFVAIWARAFSITQANLPGSKLSVWDSLFHKRVRQNYIEFFVNAKRERKKIADLFSGILTYTPEDIMSKPAGASYPVFEFKDGTFERSEVPFVFRAKNPAPGFKKGLYFAWKSPIRVDEAPHLMSSCDGIPHTEGKKLFYAACAYLLNPIGSNPPKLTKDEKAAMKAIKDAFYKIVDSIPTLQKTAIELDQALSMENEVIGAMTRPSGQ